MPPSLPNGPDRNKNSSPDHDSTKDDHSSSNGNSTSGTSVEEEQEEEDNSFFAQFEEIQIAERDLRNAPITSASNTADGPYINGHRSLKSVYPTGASLDMSNQVRIQRLSHDPNDYGNNSNQEYPPEFHIPPYQGTGQAAHPHPGPTAWTPLASVVRLIGRPLSAPAVQSSAPILALETASEGSRSPRAASAPCQWLLSSPIFPPPTADPEAELMEWQ